MPNKDPRQTRLEKYEQLANVLAQNMIYNSLRGVDLIDNYGKNSDLTPYNVFLKILNDHPGKNFQCPTRNIVIVGSGASRNACDAAPTGVEAANDLKEKYSKLLTVHEHLKKDKEYPSTLPTKNLLEDELARLSDVYRLPLHEFETILLSISKFVPDSLLEDLRELYQHEFYPNLTYEILAHLFKHRFIDVIINFNFDEILDRSIKDELNEYSYLNIVSDGDYDDLHDLLLNENLKLPLYIKPHGTISAPSTLKFTDEDYFRIAKGITELLDFLLSGSLSAQSGDSDKRVKINLIIIGFAMNSMEFNKVLFKQPHSDNFQFFIFDSVPNAIKSRIHAGMIDKDTMTRQSVVDESIEKDSPTWVDIKNKEKMDYGLLQNSCLHDYPSLSEYIQAESKSLDDHFFFLWLKTVSLFKDPFRPRSIGRHILISTFFGENRNFHKPPMRVWYLIQRIYLEFGMSIMKYRGFVNVSQMSVDRIGKYYNEYEKQVKKHFDDIKGIYPGFQVYSLMDLCKEFRMNEIGYGKHALKKNLCKDEQADNIDGQARIAFNVIWSDLQRIANGPIRDFEDSLLAVDAPEIEEIDRFEKRLMEHKEVLKNAFEELYKGDQVEVCPKYQTIYDNRFKNPKVISTYFGLKYSSYYSLVNQKGRVIILNIAESGEWLTKTIETFKKLEAKIKKVFMIIASTDDNPQNEQNPFDPKQFSFKVKLTELWWTDHNRHMSIIIPENELKRAIKKLGANKENIVSNLDFISDLKASVLYFERRLNNAQIIPVLLKDKEDVQICLESFVAYWIKAQNRKENVNRHINIEEVQTFPLLTLLESE